MLASSELGPAGDGGFVYRISSAAEPNAVPGDCSGDARIDISDPVCLLGFLFLGNPGRLPCGDGTGVHPSNRTLLDWSGDGSIDLTDAVAHLAWLFTGGGPHPLYAGGAPSCKAIPFCPEAGSPCK